jgi:hypothetical protein
MIEPYFNFADLKIDDLKESEILTKYYKDPYYHLRRPIEPERLKNIYQNAFIYDLLYSFAKEYFKATNNQTKEINKHKSTDTTVDIIRQKVLNYLFKNGVEEAKIEKNPTLFEKLSDDKIESIWSTEELNTLRKHFSAIKDENVTLRSKLAVLNEKSKLLEEKYERLANETRHMPDELISLEKDNQRLFIRLQEVEKSYATNFNELKNMDNLVNQFKDEIKSMKLMNQCILNQNAKIDYELKKSEEKIKTIKNELRMKFNEKLEEIKLNNFKEVSLLTRKMNNFKKQYKNEIETHDRTKKALEQLRTHFMSSNLYNMEKLKINQNPSIIQSDQIQII